MLNLPPVGEILKIQWFRLAKNAFSSYNTSTPPFLKQPPYFAQPHPFYGKIFNPPIIEKFWKLISPFVKGGGYHYLKLSTMGHSGK